MARRKRHRRSHRPTGVLRRAPDCVWVKGAGMSVVNEIAVWAGEQAAWVSDAVRRLIAQGTLSSADVADIAALVKVEQGIDDPQKRAATKLDPTAPIAEVQASADVCLTAIAGPKNINAIGSVDGITFAPDGLTVVYGYNGAGKSGYARVLKKACRARTSEAIVPNIFAPPNPPAPATARFEWRAGNLQDGAEWTDGSAPPVPLSKIAVFDSRCARVFVDDQAEVAYIPYGMDVLRELAVGQQAVQRLLEVELAAVTFDKSKLTALAGETVVGRLISSLKGTTPAQTVKDLAELSGAEMEELALLIKLLREEDPAKQAAVLRRFAARVQVVENELTLLEAPFSDEHVQKLRAAFEQLIAAEMASKIAATDLQDGGRALPGTGSDPWEILVRSAIAFATEQAYPHDPFPGPDGASCVLCQQPLSLDARDRLVQFVRFLEADAQKQFTEKRKQAVEIYKTIANVNISGFPSDRIFFDEVDEFSPELVAMIQAFLRALEARQAAIKAAAPNRNIGAIDPLPLSPAAALKSLRESRIAQAAELDRALTPEQRRAKLARLVDLEARQKLKSLLPTVLEAIDALKLERALREAVKRCNTTAVTRKINELYEKTVTAELRSALASELAELRLRGIKIGLEMSGQKGARMQQLKLPASGQFGKVKVSDILSEGEQRAIALASFLAEISLEQGKSGIVFDDPVSSLDHLRREQIARRLAREAKVRQVIVFTHDLAFAWSLREFADNYGVKHAERHVYAAGDTKGHCADALPFEAKKLDARVNDLRALSARAKKLLEQEKDHESYNNLVRNGYRRMRDTWELLIEDLLFAGTVKRFRRSVNTLRLRAVMVEDEDIKPVYEGMTRCSSFTHEGGSEAPPPLPAPDEFNADVEALGSALSAITAKTKAVEQRRKEAGMSG